MNKNAHVTRVTDAKKKGVAFGRPPLFFPPAAEFIRVFSAWHTDQISARKSAALLHVGPKFFEMDTC